ncbi:MAG: protein kinase, partial [Phycisphaerae bacterium]|nr:protein kinase [Phycisphaerae bacterium]
PRLPLSGTPGEGAPLLGRYRLDHVIHPGRTSYVFRGTDLHTGEMVAIKQLTVSRDVDEIAWQRFQREAEALKRLDHPGIVRLRDAFRNADFEYIVMEYVYGGSLFDRLNREGRLPLRAAVGIAAQLAGALDHAHARPVVQPTLIGEPHAIADRNRRTLLDEQRAQLAAGGALPGDAVGVDLRHEAVDRGDDALEPLGLVHRRQVSVVDDQRALAGDRPLGPHGFGAVGVDDALLV